MPVTLEDGTETELDHGHVVIAAITSCTNTSNPSVMLGSGLLARNAVQKGLKSKPWVKTSLAPGSKVVTEYLDRAGLTDDLEALGFHLVGYGCTTCIGNSGPLPEEISDVVQAEDLAVVSVLSGNRNFEGRINPDVKMNYLASPPLCVAYAIAGTMDIDLLDEPLGQDQDGNDVFLKDIWPSEQEIAETVESAVQSDMFRKSYDEVFDGDEHWNSLEVPTGDRFEWDEDSTYVRQPPYFEDFPAEPEDVTDIEGARVLAKLGDSVTTDHISPAGNIKEASPAGEYLKEHGVERKDFNSYGARRGNHEVMVRGTFANIRLRNQLAPGTEGGVTKFQPDGDEMTIYEAAMKYAENDTPLVVLAGKEYGSGLVARLGGQGHQAARRARGDRGVLRAHPPLQPRRHGRAAAAVPRGRGRRVARAQRRGGVLDHRPGGRVGQGGHRQGRRQGVQGAGADRHPEGGRVLPARRDPAVRAAPADGGRRVSVPDVLRRLLTAAGPSGYEQAPAAVFRDACASFADVTQDTVGSTVARVRGSGDGPLVAIAGHIDEIGLIVHHIDDDGYLWFTAVGGWDTVVLVGQRLEVLTREGPVPGVVGKRPIHLLDGEERKKAPELKHLHIDIGAKDGDDARSLVRIGDVAVIGGEPVEFPNGRLVSRSLDNRLGCYVAYEAARLVAEAGDATADVCALAVTQEEITFAGARTTAFSLEPDLVVVVDVTFATDQPDLNEKELGRHRFGSGPVIQRGSTLDPVAFELLHETAEAEGIPFTVTASARSTGTDADAIHAARGGIPSAVVSIPLRYMHSPVEMVQMDDVENTARLLAAFARRLDAGVSFVR